MQQKKTYNTKQRDEIILCIKSFGDTHFKASDVIKRLSEQGLSTGQATVYRMIDRLVEAGELRKYVIDGTTAACFQAANAIIPDCRCHYHLKCERCGTLLHVECTELDGLSEHISENHGFEIDSAKTVLYGFCGNCKKSEKDR